MIDPDAVEATDEEIVQHALICRDCTLLTGEIDITDEFFRAHPHLEYLTYVGVWGVRFTVAFPAPHFSAGDLADCEAWANRKIN